MKATSISVLVSHYRTASVITEESVSFSVFRKEQHFEPVLHLEERGEVSFTLIDHCIVPESTLNDETLEVINSIILEVE